MKNIGILISQLNSGGAERVASHLTKILSSDYNVYLILFEDTFIEYDYCGTLCDLDVPNTNGILGRIKAACKRIKKLNDVVKDNNIDCIISLLDSPNFVNAFSKVNKKVLSIRNYEIPERINIRIFLYQLILKLAYRKADILVSVSRQIEKDISSRFKIPKTKVTTIYNPYDFEEIVSKGEEALNDLEKHFFDEHFVFVNVSRIVHQKGIWHLLKAFARVKSIYPDAGLVLIGEDWSGGRLKSLITNLGLDEAVLLTGRVKNPFKYEKKAQVYVLSSLYEGFPNSLVEAMITGIPVIAADCKSGPREILNKSFNLNDTYEDIKICDYGIIVPPLEEEENWSERTITEGEKKLARAMLMLYDNKSLQQELSEKGKIRCKDFSYSRCKKRFISIIE